MFANIILAVSNFTCLSPLIFSFKNKDFITFGCILFVSLASFSSHLIENHKHGMEGIGFSKRTSYVLNRLDVFGCLITTSRFLYLYIMKHGITFDKRLLIYLFPLILLRISEYDKYNVQLKNRYVVCHTLWHFSVFVCMKDFLQTLIY